MNPEIGLKDRDEADCDFIVESLLGIRNAGRAMKLAIARSFMRQAPDFSEKEPGVWIRADMPLSSIRACAVDIETTGYSSGADRITEISCVRFDGSGALEAFSSLVNPGVKVPPPITRFTGISDSMLRDKPGIAAVLPVFLDFIGSGPVVFHHAPFDLGFINKNLVDADLGLLSNRVFDTCAMSRKFLKLRSNSLDSVAEHFNVSIKDRHRAQGDAEATALVFIKFINHLNGLNIKTLDSLSSVMNADK